MKAKNFLMKSAKWLLVIGGLNWGLSLFKFDLVAWLSNALSFSWIPTLVYVLVGVSALFVGFHYITGKD